MMVTALTGSVTGQEIRVGDHQRTASAGPPGRSLHFRFAPNELGACVAGASTLLRASRAWLSRAESACQMTPIGRSGAKSTLPVMIWGRSSSRILLSPAEVEGSAD